MGSAFSRAQAANGLKNANTATLRSALTNYINATKNLKNKKSVLSAINNKPAGSIRTYRNMIGNGVANAVVAARGANLAVNAANAGVIPETVAAAHVNNAAKQINNLNRAIANINTTNFANNAAKNAYKTKLMNIVKASGIALNNKRIVAAYNKLNAKALKQANNNTVAGFNTLPGNNAVANSKNKTKRLNNTLKAAGNNNNTLTGNMFKQANNAANIAKKTALQQGKTEQTANANAARAAAQTAVENAPPNANANAIRQAAKAATLAAGATPAAAKNASQMVTQNLNKEKKN